MRQIFTNNDGQPIEVFWGEIAPCEHLVQIYRYESTFFDALEGFVAGGLRAGEAVVVVATATHLMVLEQRLAAAGIDVSRAINDEQYLPLDAREVLDRFMVDGWPDDVRFDQVISELLQRAGQRGRRVRAFGEMVALLWNEGHTGATVRLEHLWHRLCHQLGLSLFCAYPRTAFTQDADKSIQEICAVHSKVLHS